MKKLLKNKKIRPRLLRLKILIMHLENLIIIDQAYYNIILDLKKKKIIKKFKIRDI